MIPNKATSLFLAPANLDIEAHIVPFTDDLLPKIVPGWWQDPSLKEDFHPVPIDRNWDWTDLSIDFDGRILAYEKLAIVTGDQEVQGAILLSTDAVESVLEPGKQALFLERLFTAPRNRPNLRKDNSPYYLGVGVELLICAAELSRKSGNGGRIRLDSSPDATAWYERRGLKKLPLDRMIFEDVEYTPMELPTVAATTLLASKTARAKSMKQPTKTKKTKFVLPKGLKVVKGPANSTRRAWHREKDITGSGGCRPAHVRA